MDLKCSCSEENEAAVSLPSSMENSYFSVCGDLDLRVRVRVVLHTQPGDSDRFI